jgi:RNA polymerase sigma-70 factor (ECF subfamily)
MFNWITKNELKLGNPKAFKEVFRVLYPRLKGYCRLFIHNEDQIEDIIQESFITLWEKHDTIKPDKSVESFVFVIVRNSCLNYLKKEKLNNNQINLDKIKIEELQYLYQLDFTNKEEKSVEELLIESFQSAVNELPDKMKQVFTLCKIEGRKQKEVAEELGISLKMVEKHISKSKQQIRNKLANQYPLLIVLITYLFE